MGRTFRGRRARAAETGATARGGRQGPRAWEGTEQAPAAAAPPPRAGSGARAAGRGGARAGREECGGGAPGPSARGSAAPRGPGSRAGGAPASGTSRRWNPRNAGLQELRLQAREKPRTCMRSLRKVFQEVRAGEGGRDGTAWSEGRGSGGGDATAADPGSRRSRRGGKQEGRIPVRPPNTAGAGHWQRRAH